MSHNVVLVMLRKLKTTPIKCRLGDNSLNWVIEAMNKELTPIELKSLFTVKPDT